MVAAAESPFYSYAAAVPETEPLFPRLSRHLDDMTRFLASLPEDKAGYAYAPGKWTVRQVVGHVWVAHRVFVTRAVSIARGETQNLPGFDEDAYARGWPTPDVTLAELTEAYDAEARATRIWALLLEEDELRREGRANGLAMRPEQILRALVGHESHHRAILTERYGIVVPARHEGREGSEGNKPA